jgi:hypothetical protein
MTQQNENQKDTDVYLLDKLNIGAVIRSAFWIKNKSYGELK